MFPWSMVVVVAVVAEAVILQWRALFISHVTYKFLQNVTINDREPTMAVRIFRFHGTQYRTDGRYNQGDL
jgi:hypothetical protein